MRYIYSCDCGITLDSELARDIAAAVDLHNGSDQTHLAWEHGAQR